VRGISSSVQSCFLPNKRNTKENRREERSKQNKRIQKQQLMQNRKKQEKLQSQKRHSGLYILSGKIDSGRRMLEHGGDHDLAGTHNIKKTMIAGDSDTNQPVQKHQALPYIDDDTGGLLNRHGKIYLDRKEHQTKENHDETIVNNKLAKYNDPSHGREVSRIEPKRVLDRQHEIHTEKESNHVLQSHREDGHVRAALEDKNTGKGIEDKHIYRPMEEKHGNRVMENKHKNKIIEDRNVKKPLDERHVRGAMEDKQVRKMVSPSEHKPSMVDSRSSKGARELRSLLTHDNNPAKAEMLRKQNNALKEKQKKTCQVKAEAKKSKTQKNAKSAPKGKK